MSKGCKRGLLDPGWMYESAQRLYSTLPYRYFKNGYSFPAWHYFLEVTRRCNLRCRMCQYIEWLENVPVKQQMEGELSTEEWIRVIDQLHRFSLVTFTGGEPFVRRDFMELLTRASSRMRTHFISNTTMLPEDRAEAVVALSPRRLGGLGLNFVGTSIEAPGDRHDEIRKMKGAFERSMSGIRLLRDCRDKSRKACPMIHVTTVIQKSNVDVLPLIPRVLKEAGVEVMNLVTETRMHELPNLGEADPRLYQESEVAYPRIDRQALSEALEQTVSAAQEAGIELRLPRMPKEEILNYYDGVIHLRDFECRNAWNTLFIGRTGDVYPCWIRRVGNVREHSIRALWNNATMREFRQWCQKGLFAPCPGCCFIDHKTDRDPFGGCTRQG